MVEVFEPPEDGQTARPQGILRVTFWLQFSYNL